MSTGRNRSEGWTYAKRSGHKNEDNVEKLFEDPTYCRAFEQRLGLSSKIVKAQCGGICEKQADGILGRKTKLKPDLRISLEDGTNINVSIKKSLAGQVFLVKTDRFIEGFEKHFKKTIPNTVKESLKLFFDGAEAKATELLKNPAVVKGENQDVIDYQVPRHRLVGKSLYNYSPEAYKELIEWFRNNIKDIADFSFIRGFVVNNKYYADYVWYINEVGDTTIDVIYKASDIINNVEKRKMAVNYGSRNGGSTIELPFGFVQWHLKSMQFHHQYKEIIQLGIQSY